MLVTVVATPVPPANVSVSVPRVTESVPVPPAILNDVDIAAVVTPVTRPLALTVTTGIAVADPKVPTLLLTVANVPAAVMLPDPSNDGLVYVRSPVIAIVLAAANLVAVSALPVKAPTNVVEVTDVNPARVVEDAPSVSHRAHRPCI